MKRNQRSTSLWRRSSELSPIHQRQWQRRRCCPVISWLNTTSSHLYPTISPTWWRRCSPTAPWQSLSGDGWEGIPHTDQGDGWEGIPHTDQGDGWERIPHTDQGDSCCSQPAAQQRWLREVLLRCAQDPYRVSPKYELRHFDRTVAVQNECRHCLPSICWPMTWSPWRSASLWNITLLTTELHQWWKHQWWNELYYIDDMVSVVKWIVYMLTRCFTNKDHMPKFVLIFLLWWGYKNYGFYWQFMVLSIPD